MLRVRSGVAKLSSFALDGHLTSIYHLTFIGPFGDLLIMPEIASALRDHSIASMTGASQTVFPEATFSGIQERFIYNPNATGSVWINPFGGASAANAAGCMELPPGTGWAGKVTNAITAIGTAAAKLTAGER